MAGMFPAGAQKTLHNGIVLPQQWPPRHEVPSERQEMPLPYMENHPEVVPINVGRQLLVDDFLIASTDMRRTCHHAVMYSGNPVISPDREWEMTFEGSPYAAPFSDGVWYDEVKGRFRMWYLAGAGTLYPTRQSFYTAYAESEDGRHWTKPLQDVLPGTNVVETANRDAATVWIDKAETDTSRRYKLFNVEKSSRGWQIVLKYSSDGIHWSAGQAQSGYLGDRTTVFYNPFLGRWAVSMRYSNSLDGRSRAYLEHEDPEMLVSLAHNIRSDVQDRNVVYWFSPDDKEMVNPDYPDVKPAIYNFDAVPYESIMLGQYAMWRGPENDVCARDHIQKRNEIGLGYSRDGFHFYRPDHSPFMGVNMTEGAWNWGNMQSACGAPLIVGDSLYFYCSGRMRNDVMWDGHVSTGLATLRRDGFVSMDAGSEGGFLETVDLTFDGEYMFVNASARKLVVEVLDEEGNAIDGFSAKDCRALKNIDGTKVSVGWKGGRSLSELAGRVVRFRFTVTEGELYSFWVSPWETGESRGYTAGGGPGLSPSGRDVRQ